MSSLLECLLRRSFGMTRQLPLVGGVLRSCSPSSASQSPCSHMNLTAHSCAFSRESPRQASGDHRLSAAAHAALVLDRWSIYWKDIDGGKEMRITPPGRDFFTPAAFHAGDRRVAVAFQDANKIRCAKVAMHSAHHTPRHLRCCP